MTIQEFNKTIIEYAELYGIENEEAECLFLESISMAFGNLFVYRTTKENDVLFFISKPSGLKRISYSPSIKTKVKNIFHKKSINASIRKRIAIIKAIKKNDNGIAIGKIIKKNDNGFLIKCKFGYAILPLNLIHKNEMENLQPDIEMYFKIHSYKTADNVLTVFLDAKHKEIDNFILTKTIIGTTDKVLKYYRNKDGAIKIFTNEKPTSLFKERVKAYYPNLKVKFIWNKECIPNKI